MLDVFAGTGAVGLESLSRGAARAVFIETDPRAAALIAENAALCGASDRCVIIRDSGGARAAADRSTVIHFDLVMLDPPYDFEPLAAVVGAAARQLAPDGLLILEHASRRAVPAVDGVARACAPCAPATAH